MRALHNAGIRNRTPNGETMTETTKPDAPAKATPKPATGTETVTVALKHPTGLVLECFREEAGSEPVLGGGMRKVAVWRSTGQQYVVHGTRVPAGATPNYPIVAGYALTHGVPKEVWETWLKQHKDSPVVLNHLIRAYASGEDAAAFAKDHEATRSGLEPLLRRSDPRVDKKRNRDGKFVDAVVVADEQPSNQAA
jgi:hypothetical protein